MTNWSRAGRNNSTQIVSENGPGRFAEAPRFAFGDNPLHDGSVGRKATSLDGEPLRPRRSNLRRIHFVAITALLPYLQIEIFEFCKQAGMQAWNSMWYRELDTAVGPNVTPQISATAQPLFTAMKCATRRARSDATVAQPTLLTKRICDKAVFYAPSEKTYHRIKQYN